MRKDFLSLGFLFCLLFVFYPSLFLVKSASLVGDHFEQHYPWAYLLSQYVKQFKLPFWTQLTHCGFPIAAESQIGIFYFPNLILSFFLPFHCAYSYTNLVHFFISGWGTYAYSKEMKLTSQGALLAACVFVFGTAYGGAYYNITSLKTISWFPVILFLFERFNRVGQKRYLFLLSIAIASAIVAGYLQIAIFMLLITAFYCFVRIFLFNEPQKRATKKQAKLFGLVICGLGALLFAGPQLFLSFELAFHSNRASLTEDFAYVGSMPPVAFLTLAIPTVQGLIRGNSLYCGIFSLFLVFFAIFGEIKKSNLVKIWIATGIFSLLLALGEWSPLYIALIKLTQFYSFRMPSKFLVFICFAISILAGKGLDEALKNSEAKKTNTHAVKTGKAVLGLFGLSTFVSGGVLVSLIYWRKQVEQFGMLFIERFVYGRAGHPHSLEIYQKNLRNYLNEVLTYFLPDRFWNLWVFGLLIFGIILASYLISKKRVTKLWIYTGLIFLLFDLYVFSWNDIKKDFARYDQIQQTSPIIEFLKLKNEEGTLGRIYVFRMPHERPILIPNTNMLHDIRDIGAYSPLVMKRYYELFGFLGNINDSDLVFSPNKEVVLSKMNLLNLMNVSHIVSTQLLDGSKLKLIMKEDESQTYLYENLSVHRDAFFISNVEILNQWDDLKSRFFAENFDPFKTLLLDRKEAAKLGILGPDPKKSVATIVQESNRDDHRIWRVSATGPGFFVISNTHYPGWYATLNGIEVPIGRAYGLFQCVSIRKAGEYRIEFRYNPFLRKGEA